MTTVRTGNRASTPPPGRRGSRDSAAAAACDAPGQLGGQQQQKPQQQQLGEHASLDKAGAADGKAAGGTTVEVDDSDALLQIKLLAAARAVFQMSRICMGPLVVVMTSDYGYTAEQKGQILSSFAGGYMLTQVVGGMAADAVGGAPVILFGLLTSACATVALPWAADQGVDQLWWLLWIMGFTQGPTYPAQLANTAKWATGSLRSYASALGGAGSTAGSLLALGLTPVVAARIGWRMTAVAAGALVFVFAGVWHHLSRSSPDASASRRPSEGSREAAPDAPAGRPVQPQAADADAKRGGDLWELVARKIALSLRLLLSVPVWACIFAHAVHNFVRYFLMSWMPTYYNDVLRASPGQAGFLLLLPEFFGLLASIAGGHFGSHLQRSGFISALTSRRLFASIAFLGSMGGLLAAVRASSAIEFTLCLCFVQGCASLQGLGFGANYLDVSKHSGGLVSGLGNTVATGASFVAPVFASSFLTPSKADLPGASSEEDWSWLFVAFALSNVVGIALFVPFCSVTPVDGDREVKKDKAD